jgi:hypothetical protein
MLPTMIHCGQCWGANFLRSLLEGCGGWNYDLLAIKAPHSPDSNFFSLQIKICVKLVCVALGLGRFGGEASEVWFLPVAGFPVLRGTVPQQAEGTSISKLGAHWSP